ncbi:hypothetical protein ACFFKU_01235 [Kineococcus gynurae]|uniref:Tetratricopeptide repeat protein n=1 Tax=Kineococcus gynurae TaxID=452979 RepID=A0ABV5LQ53_9ACTN
MRTPLTPGDLEAVELAAAPDPRSQQAVADLLQLWATGTHPDDSVSRGRLLVAASEHAVFANESARAVRLAREAIETRDTVSPDTRCYLISALLADDQLCEALELTEDVLDDRGGDAEVLVFLGEEFGFHGQPRLAHLILTRGLYRCADDEEATELLLSALRRIRSAAPSSVDVRDVIPARPGPGWLTA